MICVNCCDGRESECWGITKHKTWCDWQGHPHDTVILQSQFCKHLRASDTYCPTCGKVFDGENNQVEPTTEEPDYLSFGPAEEKQRDEDTKQAIDDYIAGSQQLISEIERDKRDNFS